MSRQKKLEESLRDLRKTRNVLDFIQLLKVYKCKQIIKRVCYMVSDIFDEEECLINKLKFLFGLKLSLDAVEWSTGYFRICAELYGETALGCNKDITEKLFNLLDCSEESSSGRSFSEAIAGLLRVLQSEDGNLREALIKIIKETEAIVTESRKYLIYSTRQHFNEGKGTDILDIGMCIASKACDSKADEVLKLVLRIGDSHDEFSEKEKEIIGKLMLDAVVPIQLYMRRVFITHGHRSFIFIRRRKAALEIILDDYATYTPLSIYKMPEYRKLNEGIELLSKVNKDCCDSSNSDSDSDSD
ncbi:uncharacterized protein [Parasteatoda tepidariorum]|uniref:uncharacterized protein n=1 Tax=Parasteatoda tepidariorum TaxID=114398 RepID=UPI00077FCAC3|nr:uncharacterized protein LOC107453994 [Parasteatoda tepidariorum]XP_042896724.1 uncharacterized protein LOC107453994 [Parasteatoda tepidariorum]